MFVEKYKRALSVLSRKPMMLWGLSLLAVVLGFVAKLVCGGFMAVGIAASYLFTCGMAKVYLDGLKGKEVNSTQLFAAFNKNCLRIAGGMAWKDLWYFIWMLVPIAGPIIALVKGYSYAFTPYILMTKPEVTATDALKLSMEKTNGKKLQMFLADLCFGLIVGVAMLVLSLLSAIPFIGILFGIVYFAFMVLVALFTPIFKGLYMAAFYEDAPAPQQGYGYAPQQGYAPRQGYAPQQPQYAPQQRQAAPQQGYAPQQPQQRQAAPQQAPQYAPQQRQAAPQQGYAPQQPQYAPQQAPQQQGYNPNNYQQNQ